LRCHAYQLVAGIICGVLLGGTANAQDPADFRLYKTDFASDGAGFYFYPVDDGTTPCIPGEPGTPVSTWSRAGCLAFVPWLDGHIESHGPWWVDPNHRYDAASAFPGAGFLHVLAFVWHGTLPLDLTDATVRFRMLLQDADLKGGRIHFWFQAPCVPSAHQTCEFAFADYALEAPIDQVLIPDAWTGLSLRLPPIESEWRCLGTHPGGIYGCVPLADALKKVENFGFILLPVPPDPDGTNSASGSIGIDDIEIVRSPIEHVTWTSASGVVARATL
jgi:hypothetical protein